MRDLASLRLDYSAQSLDEYEVDPDPVRQFSIWFDQAVDRGTARTECDDARDGDSRGRAIGSNSLAQRIR